MMDIDDSYIKNLIMFKKDKEIEEALHLGWDPNAGGGWPIRLAARYGCYSIVEILIKYGANPHVLSESGASTLQLAVYSGEHWASERWAFLLSCCDSSQLADAAAVAIIFNNTNALERIFQTGRCNAHIPTTLTGKTLEQLAKGYKITSLLSCSSSQSNSPVARAVPHSPSNTRASSQSNSAVARAVPHSPSNTRAHRSGSRNTLSAQPPHPQRNLSPSVARFFQQTASQPSLTSPRSTHTDSPSAQYFN